MKTDSFRGRDFLTLLDWSKEEVETILDVALDLKRRWTSSGATPSVSVTTTSCPPRRCS